MGRRPTGRPTSFDIAYLAGVSQPTVSRALRGDKAVSLATREKIEKIAGELNYTVDKNASSLRSQRSNTLALLFFEDPTPDDSMINPFFLAMLASITRACAQRGLDLLISFQTSDENWHVRYQDSHRADGLILLGYGDYAVYESKLEQLVEQGTKFVRWGSVTGDNFGVTIGSDNFGAGQTAARHLLSIGKRKVAFLGQADEHYPEFADRYLGLCAELRDALGPDLSVPRRDALNAEEDGYLAMQALLRSGAELDSVFTGSDLIAIGALRALAEAGLRVPHDIAVIGFDDLPAASLSTPPLTTLMQDTKNAGHLLVEALMAQIRGEELPERSLPAKLIARASTVVG